MPDSPCCYIYAWNWLIDCFIYPWMLKYIQMLRAEQSTTIKNKMCKPWREGNKTRLTLSKNSRPFNLHLKWYITVADAGSYFFMCNGSIICIFSCSYWPFFFNAIKIMKSKKKESNNKYFIIITWTDLPTEQK